MHIMTENNFRKMYEKQIQKAIKEFYQLVQMSCSCP